MIAIKMAEKLVDYQIIWSNISDAEC